MADTSHILEICKKNVTFNLTDVTSFHPLEVVDRVRFKCVKI